MFILLELKLKHYRLEGLSCADCASKIEQRVKAVEGVKLVSINLATSILSVETETPAKEAGIEAKARTIVAELEPTVRFSSPDTARPETESVKSFGFKTLLTNPLHRILTALPVFLIFVIFTFPVTAERIVFILIFALTGWDILYRSLRNILKGRVFDEFFLMSVATVGALLLGDYAEAVAVMLFYQAGEYLQRRAVNRSRKALSSLLDIRPDFARVRTDGELKTVAPESVGTGDLIVVQPGERIPLDGIIVSGSGEIDSSSITGESLPRAVFPGDGIDSGCINLNTLLEISVTREYGESTVARILELVENAAGKKAPEERFISRFARIYTPVVVIAALLIALIPPVVTQTAFSIWVYRALVFLVVSCPCALVLSVPLGFFAGIGAASRKGVLIKGGSALDALHRARTIVFDKTGTITRGTFSVTEVQPVEPFTEHELLRAAAAVERHSTHPVARTIAALGPAADERDFSRLEEISGKRHSCREQRRDLSCRKIGTFHRRRNQD